MHGAGWELSGPVWELSGTVWKLSGAVWELSERFRIIAQWRRTCHRSAKLPARDMLHERACHAPQSASSSDWRSLSLHPRVLLTEVSSASRCRTGLPPSTWVCKKLIHSRVPNPGRARPKNENSADLDEKRGPFFGARFQINSYVRAHFGVRFPDPFFGPCCDKRLQVPGTPPCFSEHPGSV